MSKTILMTGFEHGKTPPKSENKKGIDLCVPSSIENLEIFFDRLLYFSRLQEEGHGNNGGYVITRQGNYSFSIPDPTKPYEWKVEISPPTSQQSVHPTGGSLRHLTANPARRSQSEKVG